jgi:hypothetical protein
MWLRGGTDWRWVGWSIVKVGNRKKTVILQSFPEVDIFVVWSGRGKHLWLDLTTLNNCGDGADRFAG